MTEDVEFYRTHSRWSDPGRWAPLLAEIPPTPEAVVRGVAGLLLHPWVAPMRNVEVPARAADDREVRSVAAILDRVLARDGRSLTAARAPENKVFCVCAGIARVATAVFRTHGVPARCRVGFASYFTPGFLEDHWVCEYRQGAEWRRLDAQLDEAAVRELGIDFPPWDVPAGQFVEASAAWCRLRAGELDPAKVGLSAIGLAGTWFVVGSLMLEVAALNKEEMLPWEKWSVGRDCGPGQDVSPPWAAAFDEVAGLLRGMPDAALAQRIYRDNEWLRVTPTVLSFASGVPAEIAV